MFGHLMIMVGRQSITLHDLTHENGNERCNDDTWCIMIVINLLTIVCMNVWTFCTVGKLHLFQVCLKCHFALFIIQQYPYFVSWSEQIRHYCYFLTKFHYNEKSRSRALEQLTSKFKNSTNNDRTFGMMVRCRRGVCTNICLDSMLRKRRHVHRCLSH